MVSASARPRRFGGLASFWASLREGPPQSFDAETLEGVRAQNRAAGRPRVVFIDTANGARSQMAEAFALACGLDARSGGLMPTGDAPEEMLRVMGERGYDLTGWRAKAVGSLQAGERVIAFVPLPAELKRGSHEQWNALEPRGFPTEGFRMVRDVIERRVRRLAQSLLGDEAKPAPPVAPAALPASRDGAENAAVGAQSTGARAPEAPVIGAAVSHTAASNKTLAQLKAEHPVPPRDYVSPVRAEHEEQSGFRNYIRDITLGFNDGVVSVFAAVAGLAGASRGSHEIGVAGLAFSLAGAMSMGIGEYLSTRSQAEYYDAEARRELEHIRSYPDLEREEIREILREKHYPTPLVEPLVEHVAGDEKRFVDFMMREEFGVGKESFRSAWMAAGIIMVAFLIGAAIPVVPFFFTAATFTGMAASTLLSFGGLFAAGVAKGRVSGLNVWRSGFEMAILGSVAGAITFGVGELFHAAL